MEMVILFIINFKIKLFNIIYKKIKLAEDIGSASQFTRFLSYYFKVILIF